MTTPKTSRSMVGLTTIEVIKSLREGSRDMTTTVYRQVPEMDIFDEGANLRGTPMYRVNYCGDAFCYPVGSAGSSYSNGSNWVKNQPGHDHLLWCVGDDQLFRCRVAKSYGAWTAHWDAFGSGTYYTIDQLCGFFDVPVPRGQGQFQVVVEKVRGRLSFASIERHQQISKDGMLHFTKASFKNSDKLLAALNASWLAHVRTWQDGQEKIMALPQLYLTGLRR